MKKSNYNDFESLNEMAEGLPYGKERSLLREKALAVSDILNDERKKFEARISYVNDICMEGSFPEKYLTIFPWLLAYVGKNKDDYDTMQVLWYYKWVIMIMHEFPEISKSQIENALLDLKKKYNECGSSDKVFHDYSREVYHNLGDYEKSSYHHSKHMKFRLRDQLDDCEACVVNRILTYYIVTGNLNEALKKGKLILSGKQKCTHVPKDTYTNFIIPLLAKNKFDLAAEFVEKLEKELKKVKYGGNYKNVYPLIIYYTITSQQTKGINLVEKNFEIAFIQKSQEGKFYFYVAASNLFSKINKETIRLKFPEKFPLYNSEHEYNTASLFKWFAEETNCIAELFDTRNGNNKYKTIMSKIVSILNQQQ